MKHGHFSVFFGAPIFSHHFGSPEVDALRRNGLRFATDGRLVVDETAEVVPAGGWEGAYLKRH